MNNDEKLLSLVNKDKKKNESIKDWINRHRTQLLSAGITLSGILTTLAAINTIEGHIPKKKAPHIQFAPQPFQPFRGESFRLPSSQSSGGSSCNCQCGRDCNQIMEEIGGYQVAQNYLVKHPKIGAGLIDNLIHKGITKGFNFVGNVGLNILIEAIIKIVGEGFRKDINRLVKKYGWKSIAIIKKYAHKGINVITKKVEEKFGGMLCPQCNDFLDNEFRCGNIDSLEKMGSGWKEDLANGLTWFNKSVVAPAVRIIPGSVGEALAYAPENIHKIAELDSNWRYKNPFEEEGKQLQSYASSRSKPPKKGKGYVKPYPEYEKDSFTTLMSLIPTGIIGRAIGEKLGNPHWNMLGSGKNKNIVNIGKKTTKVMEHIPIDLLKAIFWEIVKAPPSMSIIPRKYRHDKEQLNIFGNGKCGGTKMLPNPFYTDKEKEMMILPYPNEEEEPVMTILPHPYTKPFFKKGSGVDNYSNLQDPNYNTNKLIKGVSNNQDYKDYESGMKNKAQGNIIMGGKKKQTKKNILKKLQFEN
jgi:hypothetical protein